MISLSSVSPLEQEWDVVIIGGGAAGTFAAVTAASVGAKTLLVERNGTLGGTITAAGVNFPGLFFAWGKQIIGGPCWQSILRTVELGGALLPSIQFQPKHHYDEQVLVNGFTYSYVLDQCLRQSGAEVLLHTALGAIQEISDGFLVLLGKASGALLYEGENNSGRYRRRSRCRYGRIRPGKKRHSAACYFNS